MAENNAGDLSPEQTEKLIQFQDLTGIDDMDRCRTIMERHNWNIEAAVQDRLNESEGRPTVFGSGGRDGRPEPRPPAVNTHPRDQRIYTVSRRHPQGWFQWSYMVLLFPFRFVYVTIFDIFHWVVRLFQPDPRRIVTDPVGDVMSFIRKFEELYGSAHPTFYQGTYSQVLTDAKRELKFLLVYLHGDDHQDVPSFCRETLGSLDVCEFINTRMLFWAASTNTPEGYRVSLALRESTYPFLALIVLRDNKMTVVQRIEGPVQPVDFIERLTRVMNDTEAYLVTMRHEREQRSQTNTLRQQQDVAYEESLRQDQEKEKRKREEREQREREEQEARDRELEQQRLIEEKERLKIEKAANLPEEPDPKDPDAIRIVLKLPNGIRLERCFLKSHSLEVVYDYVFIQEDAPDEFQLLTNYPRRVLPCRPGDDSPTVPSITEAGLGQKEMIYVQDVSD
ncbi:FAS-associated factor 2-like [Amphiura filiformis]|uniref:FAS-associated factor 2-like n=1 Tax=Amphiura filiformis TaxID=82378 RepID=UPI003B20E8E0